MKEQKLLEEAIRNLIYVSDVIERVRKKYNCEEMYLGQQFLVNSIEVFKFVKDKMKRLEQNKYEI